MREYEELKPLVLTYSEYGVKKNMSVRSVKDFEDLIVASCFEDNEKFQQVFWKRHFNNLALQILHTVFFIDKLLNMVELHLKLDADGVQMLTEQRVFFNLKLGSTSS